MKNLLSDIYTNEVLLEKKNNVVVPANKQEIAKGGKEPLSKGSGTAKVKGVPAPKSDKKFTGVKAKGKNLKENMNTTTNNAYEGAFEKLFKSTLTEGFGDEAEAAEVNDHADEIPTSDADVAEDIESHEDEATDLVSDIKAVIDSLTSILDKLSEHESHEGHEMGEEEAGEEVGEEAGEEEPFEESVDYEDEGHALVNAKSGKDLVGPKGKFDVKGVKVTKGKANDGDVTNEPETKELHASDTDLRSTKKFNVKTSNIKVGDFFK